MKSAAFVELGPSNIDRLVEFEVECFDPTIQASRETILKRLELGHQILGLEDDGELIGAVAYSYAYFDPHDRSQFPKNETDFGLQPIPPNYNAQFIYSRGVHPKFQGRGASKRLVGAAMQRAKRDGCQYVVGNPRTAAYAGSDPSSRHEVVAQQPRFKAAIDRYVQGGTYPSIDELLLDPSLAYFSHLPACRFHWIIPNFASHDKASGGIRVIVYVPLGEWQPAVLYKVDANGSFGQSRPQL
jgi:GNAT superfamily N-acetyltransferase